MKKSSGRIGADHRFSHRDQPNVLALEDRPSGGGFQTIPKKPIEFMNDNELKGALFADGVGKQFFERLALFQIAKR